VNGYANGPQSPDTGMNGQDWQQDQGYTTPYGNSAASGGNSGGAQWNQGGTTPYGATPYGQNGGANGWS